jgi:hypothetical protein
MYSKCCKNEKIKIPPYEEPPQFLSMLINNKDNTISKHFYQKYDNIIASSLLHQGGGILTIILTEVKGHMFSEYTTVLVPYCLRKITIPNLQNHIFLT